MWVMTIEEVEKEIKEAGPRVRESYGWEYYYGWCAAMRKMARRFEEAQK
jgi:hypothetical protein